MTFDQTEIDRIAEAVANLLLPKLTTIVAEPPEQLLSLSEAAKVANVKMHVLRDAIRRDELAAYRFGKQIRIERSELLAYGKRRLSERIENVAEVTS